MNELLWAIMRNQGLMLQILSGLCGSKGQREATFECGKEIFRIADREILGEPKTDLETLADCLTKAYENGKRGGE